jgi:hypothetical protein
MNSLRQRVICTALLLVVTLAVGATAITTQSLWMDEGNAIFKAMMPSLGEMWAYSKHMGGSEIQMPLYMLSLWGWEKIASNTEYVLRALNLPFLAIMVFALRRYRFWPLVCLTSPFVLYYVGEMRPYMFQMAGAALAFSSIFRILQRDPEDVATEGVHTLFFSSIFMAATSLTAAVCSIGLFIAVLIARPRLLGTLSFWKRVAIWSPLALLVAGYYAYTLIEGFRGAGHKAGGLLSMCFGFYEMTGMLGLGPVRDELRGGNFVVVLAGTPWLPFAALAIMAAWLVGVREFVAPFSPRARIALACSVLLPITVFAAVSVFANFNVLGRHMSPLIPAVLVPLACACDVAVRKGKERPFAAAVVLAFLGCATISSATLRFAERYARDDYRRATHLAIEALGKGRAIHWQADMNTPRYYAFRQGGMPLVRYIQKLESDVPSGYLFTDLIFINRPDLRFAGADHRPILSREGFDLKEAFPGFEIWENRSSKLH